MTTHAKAPASGLTVRARVLAFLALLSASALALGGLTAYVIERERLDAGISEELSLEAKGFIEFASGDNPSTSAPFESASDILFEGMKRLVPSPTESAVGHVGATPRFIPAGDAHLALEDDPEFMAEAAASAAAAGDSSEVRLRSVTTELADYRFVSIALLNPDSTVAGVFTLATDRGAVIEELNETFAIYAAVAVAAVGLIVGVGWVTVGRLLAPIRLLDETARAVTDADLTQRIPIVGDDDLARLSGTVNAMLDRLERAFGDQRQLLDDASHELRTPLTIVRTKLELIEPRDPDQVESTRDQLLDEVGAMSRLVDDLVTLAKADRPEFVVKERTDVAGLMATTLERARALGVRAWAIESTCDALVMADARRIEQALLQLAANSVKFSAEGSRVLLGASRGHGQVRLWVRDEGLGIAPEDLSRITERFGRVDHDAEGAGLGLPIVEAIAKAHGGSLDVESTVGKGSTFTIVIPEEAP